MAVWWLDRLMCVQMTSTPDRNVLLSLYVKKYSGKIIVSRPKYKNSNIASQKIKEIAAGNMIDITERPYGWFRIALFGLAYIFTGNTIYSAFPNSYESKWPPVCSESYSRAMRKAGFDPCLDLADCFTEPKDLFESSRMQPLFVLTND